MHGIGRGMVGKGEVCLPLILCLWEEKDSPSVLMYVILGRGVINDTAPSPWGGLLIIR